VCSRAAGSGPLVVRVFEAARPLVYAAWTDPDLMAAWCGPEGFVTPRDTVTIEPWTGGRYDYCLVQVDDGSRFWLRSRIVELAAPRLLVFESGPMPEYGVPEPVTTRVALDDVDGGGRRTRLTLTRPYPPERRASARASWSSSFEKLEALLRSTDTGPA
jgi:uncharacterized protein YndB with AHSA1/START domain